MNAGTIRLATITICICSWCISFSQIELSSLAGLDKMNAEETYHFVGNINFSQDKLTKRGAKTHRLDSVFYWTRESANDEFSENGYQKFIYSDTLEITCGYSYSNLGSYDPSFLLRHKLDSFTGKLLELDSNYDWDGNLDEIYTSESSYITKYEYNDLGYLSEITSSWVNENPNNKRVFEYNNFGSLIKETLFWKENPADTFSATWCRHFNHDSFQVLESIVRYNYVSSEGWFAEDSIHYTYNTDNLLSNISEYAPETSETWWRNYSLDFIYNNSNLVSEKIIQGFSRDGTKDQFYVVENFGHHPSNDLRNLTATLYFDMDFEPAYYFSNQHDSNINTDNVIYPHDLTDEAARWNNMILTEESTLQTNPIYLKESVLNLKSEYFYKELHTNITSEHDLEKSNIVFPNPFSDSFQFSLHELRGNSLTLELFDQNGMKVFNSNVVIGSPISVSQLVNGIYYYKLIGSEASYSGILFKF